MPGQRHWLATPCPSAWAGLLGARAELAAEPLLVGWAARGWKLVVRGRLCGDPADEIPLGLPLPPSHGKRRIALSLPQAGLIHLSPPPLLAACRASAPPAWQESIERLLALDCETRCFGSLAWQSQTGLAYLSAASDLDLLWRMPAPARLADYLAALSDIAAAAPMRIDGEIAGPGGAVQWRELAGGATMLAVKSEARIALIARSVFLGGPQA